VRLSRAERELWRADWFYKHAGHAYVAWTCPRADRRRKKHHHIMRTIAEGANRSTAIASQRSPPAVAPLGQGKFDSCISCAAGRLITRELQTAEQRNNQRSEERSSGSSLPSPALPPKTTAERPARLRTGLPSRPLGTPPTAQASSVRGQGTTLGLQTCPAALAV